MYARRVLVIEDESSAREALASLLTEEGYLVRTAPSGLDGLECNREFYPDVILCDYYLPDIDGLQVLRRVRQSGNGSTRFVMITAGLGGVDNERALRYEADAFLGKPIDLDQLHRVLESNGVRTDPRRVLHATSSKDHRHA